MSNEGSPMILGSDQTNAAQTPCLKWCVFHGSWGDHFGEECPTKPDWSNVWKNSERRIKGDSTLADDVRIEWEKADYQRMHRIFEGKKG